MAQKAGQIATNDRFADASAFLRTFSFIPRPEHNYDRWLKPDAEHPPIDLLRPYDADKMTAWKVDKAVGNVKNDRPELIDPASATSKQTEEPFRDGPGSLFT
jgi:putative SOS response-associated peptidase YedK